MNNAATAMNYAIAHHDWEMVERASSELIAQNSDLTKANNRLWLERNVGLAAISDRDTELDIARERMARPVTLIIAPAIWRWLSSLPSTLADHVQAACDWFDRKIECFMEKRL